MTLAKQEDMDDSAIQGHTPFIPSPDDTRTKCVICLNRVREPAEIDPCGHNQFHITCATRWLKPHPYCPLCKVRAVRIRHGEPPAPGVRDSRPVTEMPQPGREFLEQWPRQHETSYYQDEEEEEEDDLISIGSQTPLDLWFRHLVYRRNARCVHVEAGPQTGYRDLTPELFRAERERMDTRAGLFLRRELRALSSPFPGHYLLGSRERMAACIVSKLQYNFFWAPWGSQPGNLVEPPDVLIGIMGDAAWLLMYELCEFLRSPYGEPDDWYQNVRYSVPLCVVFEEPREEEEEEEEAPVGSGDERNIEAGSYRNRDNIQRWVDEVEDAKHRPPCPEWGQNRCPRTGRVKDAAYWRATMHPPCP
ncbi:Zinc finger, RING/FYVE/PHD-type [Cordyceps fumosorosea ARSEF 2679]|uniref:RING-type E3 ubiquitin transferase n=1 Tax=Cordyceps fumosorosea (strain ARSEF 2679) TaxID=1081104 RepID=A0A168CPN9_CORFA|nr:Zinc finger, RING/FYVE/PHD-type [Cordyceps fumosorosea ARSEF 2679]OAA71637.1 Zinc finger, RING/FYVE/PHD-type [Cordyceps fumosorosea ARSEF 2679]